MICDTDPWDRRALMELRCTSTQKARDDIAGLAGSLLQGLRHQHPDVADAKNALRDKWRSQQESALAAEESDGGDVQEP